MHHPRRGGEGLTGLLGHRQRVHVSPQQYRRCRRRLGTAQHADDRGQPGAESELEPDIGQRSGDQRLSPGKLQADFGCAVQVPAQRAKAAEQLGRLPVEASGEGQILPCEAAIPKITTKKMM